MALPLVPIAGIALRYGAVALATYAATKSIPQLRRDQNTEDILDEVQEGVEMRRDGQQANASARFRRTIRVGKSGPGLEIDLTTLTRIRIKKADKP